MKRTDDNLVNLAAFSSHPRDWRDNLYVYPVISRRSRGLSIGINLNPDMACNFDCIYCQVDRTLPPRVREVDLDRMFAELTATIAGARDGSLFDDPAFREVPAELRSVKDIAFSGDGEPTTCRQFFSAVEAAARLKQTCGLSDARIVLITDACYLTKPDVVKALALMDENNGEIWAKLDAGSEEYYQMVNRPNFPLRHVLDNIFSAARLRPVVIQSLFMRIRGKGPDEPELTAFVERLNEITSAGGLIDRVQVYTVARKPAEAYVTPLSKAEVDHITRLVATGTGLRADAYYGPE